MSEKFPSQVYDLAIIGGGVGGLGLANLMALQGYRVLLLEQKRYPFHRVCGEYLSMESWPLLQELGLELKSLPRIRRLQVTAPDGTSLLEALEPGGFGISRYSLDAQLVALARERGVTVLDGTRVRKVSFQGELFELSDGQQSWQSRAACGAFGKGSNLEQELRPTERPHVRGIPTFVGVKYHIHTAFPRDLIALHNFPGGYCGISAVDDFRDPASGQARERFNLCYLIEAGVFRAGGGQPEAVAQTILSQNPYLKSIFNHAEFLFERPYSIAQIHFQPRSQVENHLLLLGDAAGAIPPLSGNGMSMALNAARMLSQILPEYLAGRCTQAELEARYRLHWQKQFGLRLKTGRLLQHAFGQTRPINLLIQGLKHSPTLTRQLISLTHGKAF